MAENEAEKLGATDFTDPALQSVAEVVGGESKPLTNWANEPTVTELKQDLQDAKPDTDNHIAKVDRWLDNLNVTGKAKKPETKGRSSLVPKLIRKQAEWRYASLAEPFLSTPDVFDVDPETAEDVASAEQNALVLNNQFNTQIKKVKFIDDYVRAAVDEGTVVVRVGWDFQEADMPVQKPIFAYREASTPNEIQQLANATQLAQQDPGGFSVVDEDIQESVRISAEKQIPTIASITGYQTVIEKVTVKNQPTLEVCNYKNIVIDPMCKGDLDIANFMSYSFESNIAELKRDGKYTNLGRINAESQSVLSVPDHDSDEDSTFNFSDKARKKFVVYEYWGFWDIAGDGVLVPIVAAWVGNTLIRLEENPFPDKKLPFVTAQYLPVRRSIYGEPDGELLEDNQKVIGALTRGMIDVMGRSANGQMGTRKDALDVVNRRKFDQGRDYEFNGGVDPRQAFHMHTYPEIPASAQYMMNIQTAEAESLTGVKAFSGPSGLSGSSLGDSVGGAKLATDAAAKRELGILRRLAQGMNEIGRKIISMNAEFLSEEEVIRTTANEFVTIRRDDLEGKHDLRLSISTPEADEAKAKELAFMLQTTGQTMGPEFAKVILAEIAKLRKMPDLAKRIKDYTPAPDPLEEKRKQLEIELLEAKIANEQQTAIEKSTEAELNQAKVRNLGSDSDNKDLQFLEQESGTTQERELQKIDRQAKNAERKAVIDASLKEKGEARNAANSSANSD